MDTYLYNYMAQGTSLISALVSILTDNSQIFMIHKFCMMFDALITHVVEVQLLFAYIFG